MKKFVYGLMFLGLLAVSCEEPIVPDTDDTKAPVLGNIAGAVLDAKGADITTTFEAADFGKEAAGATIHYGLYVDKDGASLANKVEVPATIAEGKISFTQANLSLTLQSLGAAVGDEVKAEFALYAYLGSDVNSNSLVSNTVKATFTVCEAEVNFDTYNKVWVIGNFNGWDFGNVAANKDYLYDVEGNGTYSGLVYYDAKAANGWKIAIPRDNGDGTYSWNDESNWGFPEGGAAPELEALTATLECAGGSKDMKVWAHNFYWWHFTPETLELKMEAPDNWDGAKTPVGFDQMYLVGSFNGWKTFDADYVMKYIPTRHTFFVDVTLEAGAEIKFIADGQLSNDWYIAWGEDCSWEGGNIKVDAAGSYRVYFNFNAMSYTLDTAAFGKNEEGAIDVAVRDVNRPDEYHIFGSVLGGDWSKSVADLDRDGETSVYKYIGLAYNAGEEFKIVKNDKEAWFGVGNGQYTGTLFTLTGTDNWAFDKTGGLDITFNAETQQATIEDSPVQGWAVVGNVNGSSWNEDFPMTQNGDIWTSDVLEISYDGANTWGCKIRKYRSWTLQYGLEKGVAVAANTALSVKPSDNDNITYNGKAKLVFDAAKETVTILPQ